MASDGQKARMEQSGIDGLPKGGSETILVADDDEVLRKLTDMVLSQFGYTVILAIDGEDAIAKFMDNKDSIHFVILDIIMPKKNGKEVYDFIKGIRTDLKVLFSSGYTADIIQKEGILGSQLDFLMKPFSPVALLEKVREILDR